ncbi:MAG: DUF368 domain-containing protein [Gammaproteobacteria bacterium]|uniref:DUF368 domain-containing protein n=1 Tax=Pseudomaricurvus alcaniphilus TaxID=1166482 RepID=UPI00140DF890|nr:DUF368 domain-containing protein [Pseudomaricurvus alcaniphilus]MBR9909374.1 DUF368 domain-containing protein [Gammaproteobacteria bacterium]NHN38309.1 DUF368 domain-containing protein [Pseudomaricurvus alcaniphilus]
MKKDVNRHAGLVLRGMAMGAADVIPGVSGGTVALITGIYAELIDSLRRCDHRAVQCLFEHGVLATWRHINGSFLLAVLSGILISIFSLANLVSRVLEQSPILVWSLFFGLIVASCLHLLRQVNGWNWRRFGLLLLGVLLALLVSVLKPTQLSDDWWVVMLAGMVAICAMILPGISGGFLLLMMGLYATVVESISSLNLAVLVPFAFGCLVGLLLFSHVLSWLLRGFESATMAFLTGVLAGSLNIIWPWKQTLELIQDRHGEWVPLVQQNVSPFLYSKMTGNPSQIYLAITLCTAGFLAVLLLEIVANRHRAAT